MLDAAPVLDEQLLRLGRWIADYYLAPLGEVFRTMLPLSAEFKRAVAYGITEEGQMALHLAGTTGSSARSQRRRKSRMRRFRVLDYLARSNPGPTKTIRVREETLRSATRSFESNFGRDGAKEMDCAGRCFRSPRRHANDQVCAAEVR